ncbi:MAG: hypothetical protein QGG64_03420 [Candidatus Latescibacteria bacterium]|nr:hypothetical protein [Candidatus Latescibacterota bacterium]
MSDSLRDIMRKVGRDDVREREQGKWEERAEELLSNQEQESAKDEVEKRHDKYRRQQEYASRLGPAAERLPILSKEESERRERERPKRKTYEFEGPIEKLLEKYGDPKEIFNHMSMGQLMKYELDEDSGCIYEQGKLIFDGEKLV